MKFLPTLIFRAPLLPFNAQVSKEEVKRLLARESPFSIGVLLASPALYRNPHSEKALRSLARYYIRSKTRSTPFGLFSGTGVAYWSHSTEIILKKKRKAQVNLDLPFIQEIQKEVEKLADPNLLYFPNSSLYKAGNEIRCMTREPGPSLLSIHASNDIEALLHQAQRGLNRASCSKNQLSLFQEMIAQGLLISTLEPPCTGKDPFEELGQYIQDHETARKWKHLSVHLGRLNKELSSPTLAQFLADLPEMEKIPLHVLQTCSTHASKNTISAALQKTLLTALKRLVQWSPRYKNEKFEDFKLRFQERYSEEEVPLSEALDPEFGLEYVPSSPPSDITEGLPTSSGIPAIPKEEILEKELIELLHGDPYAIELPNRTNGDKQLNASFSLVFRLISEGDIFLEMAGGSSATSLLGRFGNSDGAIKSTLESIVKTESHWNPEVDFAEVLCLPEGRAANVVFRPSLREYDIPYLGKSPLPRDHQIDIKDLLISVVQGEIILRYRKTGRRIIPRLANAHNFRLSSLPVYRFLGDLQFQGFQPSIHFSWGKMEHMLPFLPRVYAEKVIVHPASWRIRKTDFHLIKAGHLPHCRHPLPRHFVWKNADQELWVDRENAFSLECFKDAVQQLEEIRVLEFLLPHEQAVKSAKGQVFCHQFVASIIQQRALFTDQKKTTSPMICRRDFGPGSEWVYIKYYCGTRGAERILHELVSPLIQTAMQEKWIDKWFFIRYLDPEPHIRLRLHLKHITLLPALLILCEKHSGPFTEDRSIWKVQLDTYKRELERYHAKNIEVVESLFYWDSTQYLRRSKNFEDQDWVWSLRQIKIYLNAADFSLEQKRKFVGLMRSSFASEYCIDKDKKIQIDQKYRQKRANIEKWANRKAKVPRPLRTYLHSIKKNTPHRFQEILASLIHMMVNRSIASDPRTHEYLMYEFLDRYYKSYAARKAKTNVA